MELKERTELVRKIRMGDTEAVERLILYVHKIILESPIEIYERYYENLRDEFLANFTLNDVKNIFLYSVVLHLLNDFEFLHNFERDFSSKNIESQISSKLQNVRESLNKEFTKKNDEIALQKQIYKIKRGAGGTKIKKIDSELIKLYKEECIKLPEDKRPLMTNYLYNMHITLIPKHMNINLKNTIFQIYRALSILDKNFENRGN